MGHRDTTEEARRGKGSIARQQETRTQWGKREWGGVLLRQPDTVGT